MLDIKDVKEMIYVQNSCYNDHTEIDSPHHVISDELQDLICMLNSLQNDHSKKVPRPYVFSGDL